MSVWVSRDVDPLLRISNTKESWKVKRSQAFLRCSQSYGQSFPMRGCRGGFVCHCSIGSSNGLSNPPQPCQSFPRSSQAGPWSDSEIWTHLHQSPCSRSRLRSEEVNDAVVEKCLFVWGEDSLICLEVNELIGGRVTQLLDIRGRNARILRGHEFVEIQKCGGRNF
jgi:hypothetical protein